MPTLNKQNDSLKSQIAIDTNNSNILPTTEIRIYQN
jgi:hypothetical protein